MVNLYVVVPGEYNKHTLALSQKGFRQSIKMGRTLKRFITKGKTLIITRNSAACQQTTVLMYSDLKDDCEIVPYSREVPEEEKSLNAFLMWALKSEEFMNVIFVTDKPDECEIVNKFYDSNKLIAAKILSFTYTKHSKSFLNNGIVNN